MNFVVVHRGARDHYQVALALAEAGKLESLVTDLYWPAEGRVATLAERLIGSRGATLVRARNHPELRGKSVKTRPGAGIISLALDKLPRAPFPLRARATRWTDDRLGHLAGQRAKRSGAGILSYSYYGHSAFSAAGPSVARWLFQLHPHPASMRRILLRELADYPQCAESLQKEWELALPEQQFDMLCEETQMAHNWIVASSFTRQTLIENGAPAERIHVAPYGVELERFQPTYTRPGEQGPLRILFAGTINQRKGIAYLLDALRLLNTKQIQFAIRGRAADDLALLRSSAPDVDIRLNVSNAELIEAYQTSDFFVFPSVAEGFGHVILEALACGLPVLSTTRTAALDLVTSGRDGFVIEPRRSDLIAERLEWMLMNRGRLPEMRREARAKAEQYTWPRFRSRIVDILTPHTDRATRTELTTADV
jgi:glycosyltransferase involved in cell wall biosynthesis